MCDGKGFIEKMGESGRLGHMRAAQPPETLILVLTVGAQNLLQPSQRLGGGTLYTQQHFPTFLGLISYFLSIFSLQSPSNT